MLSLRCTTSWREAGENMGAAQCHVQLFAQTGTSPVRWRLLSGNNREIGRGAESFPDAESCLVAVKELQTLVAEFAGTVRRDDGHSWIWQLTLGERLVATAAHGYDRLIRCERGMSQFRLELRNAALSPGVMISQTRRWGGASA
jgi:hypothetical protein